MDINLDLDDYNYFHDSIFDTFGESLNQRQLDKLIRLYPDFDGIMDTRSKDLLMDSICVHFSQMAIPTYGSSTEYEAEFERKIADNKQMFNQYVKLG